MEYHLFLWVALAAAGMVAVAKFGPSLVSVAGFTYPNAKFNAIGSPFLDEKELTKLIASSTLQDLQNNVVSRDFSVEGTTIQEMQHSIDTSLARTITMAHHDSPKGVHKFYETFLQLFDARFIKDVIWAVLEATSGPTQEPLSLLGKKVQEQLTEIELETLPSGLAHLGMDEVRACVEQKVPFSEVEHAIDRYLIDDLRQAKVPRSCMQSCNVFVKHFIDVMNLKALFRIKYYGSTAAKVVRFGEGRELSSWKLDHLSSIDSIPEIISLLEGTSYGVPLRDVISEYEHAGLTALEMVLDRTLLRHVANISMEDPMGLGPGIRFLIEKWYEARNLKAIVKGVGEGMDPDIIGPVVIRL